MTLAGLALQAEFGDFNVEVRKVAYYRFGKAFR